MEDRINQIIAKLRDHDVEKIVLFGSAARGESDDKSDLDLLIIKRTRKRFSRPSQGSDENTKARLRPRRPGIYTVRAS